MPTLTIRNLDQQVHRFLREQAASRGHSMEAEVRDILSQTMQHRQTKPGELARRIHESFAKIGGADDLPLPERRPLREPLSFSE